MKRLSVLSVSPTYAMVRTVERDYDCFFLLLIIRYLFTLPSDAIFLEVHTVSLSDSPITVVISLKKVTTRSQTRS